MNEPIYILDTEYLGEAEVVDGFLSIGNLQIPFDGYINSKVESGRSAGVYIRRRSNDLKVAEIHIAQHDGYAQEVLDTENEEADRYPLGPKEYWRTKFDSDEDFDEFWGDEDA